MANVLQPPQIPNPTPTANNAFQQTPTLSQIATKVRRITRSPSIQQLSNDDLYNYINTFVIYDFPEHIRTFNFRHKFSFTCNAFQDSYPTDILSFGAASNAFNNTLYNFQNLYITVHPPLYIAGFEQYFTQSREDFYRIYPQLNSIASIGPTGDGVTTNFSGVINSQQSIIPTGFNQQVTLVRNQVLFSSIDSNNTSLAMVDVPVLDSTTGIPTPYGNLYPQNSAALQAAQITPPLAAAPYTPGTGGLFANNYVNYVTGQFNITFPTAPGSGQNINSQTVPQITSLPQAMLYYNNTFTLRPIPDQPYTIEFEVFSRPTALLATNQAPELEEYWQYVAYGAAKKIFEDRMDPNSVQMIMPEFKKQEALCLRRSIVQYTNERTATIYTDQSSNMRFTGGWGFGGGSF